MKHPRWARRSCSTWARTSRAAKRRTTSTSTSGCSRSPGPCGWGSDWQERPGARVRRRGVHAAAAGSRRARVRRRTMPGRPLTVAVDVDVVTYATGSGDRRVVALGAEQWLLARRLGIRAAPGSTPSASEDRAATAGVSVSPRSGFYVDGHMSSGVDRADERGWGLGRRGCRSEGPGARAQGSRLSQESAPGPLGPEARALRPAGFLYRWPFELESCFSRRSASRPSSCRRR